MVGDAALLVQIKLYTPNETDCTAKSAVTKIAREAGESDATAEMKQGRKGSQGMDGRCFRDKIKFLDQLRKGGHKYA